jgi:Protein of unknown function (DUF3829)
MIMKKRSGFYLSGVLFSAVVLMGAQNFSSPARAQQQAAKPAQDADLRAAIVKSNAYIGLMNRSMRALESWDRYASWVNLKTGPTGNERNINYGLYSLSDMRDEIKKAREAADTAPAQPELDATIKRYIDAYEALAPAMTQANGYYERKDYKADNMAEGKVLHVKMLPAAELLAKERRLLNAQFRPFKSDIDLRELTSIEASEGKKVRWHIKNVMIEGGNIMRMMPSNVAPMVDIPAFDEVLNRYAAAVRGMDTFSQETPGQFSAFESRPRSLLGKLRDYRDKLAKVKGDARRAGGYDMQSISSDYSVMISTSQVAVRITR